MSEFQEVPEGYEADTEEFEALYVLAWLMIIKALMSLTRLPQNPTNTLMLQLERKVNKEVTEIMSVLSNKAVRMATKQVTEAYKEGVKYSRLSLSQEDKSIEAKEDTGNDDDTDFGTDTDSNTNGDTEVKLNNSHQQRLDKMISQTQSDLLKATHNTEDNIKKLVRKVVSKEMADIGNSGKIGKRSHLATRIDQQLRKQFLEAGIKDADVAIIDKANRKWRLKTYSSMVAKTKANMAYIDAIREEGLQTGSDLAIISTKPDTLDECKNYEGMVISMNGISAGYLTYEGIKKTKECFHPNCGHFIRPVASEAWIPPQYKKIHEDQMKHYMATHNVNSL